MRFVANLGLLAAALVAAGCGHCGHQDSCCEPACGGPGYYSGVQSMGQPIPARPMMEPLEAAPPAPGQY